MTVNDIKIYLHSKPKFQINKKKVFEKVFHIHLKKTKKKNSSLLNKVYEKNRLD